MAKNNIIQAIFGTIEYYINWMYKEGYLLPLACVMGLLVLYLLIFGNHANLDFSNVTANMSSGAKV